MKDERPNPETVPLRQWPFIYDGDTQHWHLDWSKLVGFLIGCALIAAAIFVIGLLFYTGLVEIGA